MIIQGGPPWVVYEKRDEGHMWPLAMFDTQKSAERYVELRVVAETPTPRGPSILSKPDKEG